MKKNKIKLFSFSIISIIASFSLIYPFINKGASDSNNLSNVTNSNLQATINGQESLLTFEFNTSVSWKGTLTPNQVTISNLQELLIPSSTSGIFTIEIQQITSTDLKNGVVRFKILQTRRTYTNGVPTSTTTEEIAPKDSTQGDVASKIWSTPSGYLINSKYNFVWASASQIESFVKGTTKKFNDLTNQEILTNLVDPTSSLPPSSQITITKSDVSTGSASQYGVGKIVINFTGTSTSDWSTGVIPTNQTLILRGLINDFNTRSYMTLNFSSTITLGNLGMNANGITAFSKYLTNITSPTFHDLYLSQFINVDNGSLQSIIDILTKGTYTNSTTPITTITYMGADLSNPTNFSSVTGIDSTTVASLGIQSIEVTGDDSIGSMNVIYKYNSLNLYSNQVESLTKVQQFGGNTFTPNLDANKNLYFSWKTDNELSFTGTSYEIANNYYNNRANTVYTTALSNEFFDGSSDTYKQERTVKIDYAGGGTYNAASQSYNPVISNDKNITVTLTFPSFNGNVYTDTSSGVAIIKQGLLVQKTFTLANYQYTQDTSGTPQLTWKSNSTIFTNNPALASILPSDIVYGIFNTATGSTPIALTSEFYTIDPTVLSNPTLSVVPFFYPDDVNGTITVRIFIQGISAAIGSGEVYQQIFTGFKANATTVPYYEFSWIPQSQVSQSLLNIPILSVTTQNVIDLYLSSIPLFKDQTLTPSNVAVQLDPNNSSALLIEVTIPMYNQGLAVPGNQKFKTVISGFSGQTNYVDSSVVSIPTNYTTILAVTISVAVTAIMGVVLGILVIRSINLRNSSKKKKK